MNRTSIRNRRGQGMVEYALLVAGIAIVAVVGVSMMGHKTADLIGTVASVLPGSHGDDNGPIRAAQVVETKNENGQVTLDTDAVTANSRRLDANLGFDEAVTDTGNDGQTFVTDKPGN